MLVFHHNDLDGECAAAILAKKFDINDPESFISIGYKDEVPIDRCKDEEVFVVDFSFTPEVMSKVREVAKSVVWCDHHVSAKDYPYQDLPGVRDFSEKGMSGCECTWLYCYSESVIPLAVQLIGDYDSWRLQTAPRCFQFYEGLKMRDTHPATGVLKDNLSSMNFVSEVILEGKTAIKYRDNYCKNMVDFIGHEIDFEGCRVYALNLGGFGSKMFGEKFDEYEFCVSYIHDGEKYTISLYSESIDVSRIAKRHGGGGHKGASGFVCYDLPWSKV